MSWIERKYVVAIYCSQRFYKQENDITLDGIYVYEDEEWQGGNDKFPLLLQSKTYGDDINIYTYYTLANVRRWQDTHTHTHKVIFIKYINYIKLIFRQICRMRTQGEYWLDDAAERLGDTVHILMLTETALDAENLVVP